MSQESVKPEWLQDLERRKTAQRGHERLSRAKVQSLSPSKGSKQTGFFKGSAPQVSLFSTSAVGDATSGNRFVDSAKQIFKAWGDGLFKEKHPESHLAYQKYVADNVVVVADATTNNTDIYRTYRGLAGMKQWMKNLELFSFPDFDFEVSAPTDEGNNVYIKTSYTPTLLSTGRTGPKITDMAIWSFNDARKVTKFQFFWGNPAALDSLFTDRGNNNDVATVKSCFAAWGEGKLNGAEALGSIHFYFNEDFIGDCFVPMQNTDIYRQYRGRNGVLEWTTNMEQLEFRGMRASFSPGSRAGEVIMQTTFTPFVKATGKEGNEVTDLNIFTVVNGKISNVKYFMDNSQKMDELFDAGINVDVNLSSSTLARNP